MCTKEPVLAFVDHANLAYYRHPQKINRRVARYISALANYNLKIIHKPGTLNQADALSRRPDYDNGKDDNTNTTALPDDLFIKHINSLTLYEKVPTAGHAGASTMLFSISRDYWWPNMKHFIMAYVRGCTTCQSNKANTWLNKPPIFPITPECDALPFQTIAVDWITKLPQSDGYDSIMTVTDHDCTKAVIFILCKETMGTEEMVELYTRNVVVHYGLPCYARTLGTFLSALWRLDCLLYGYGIVRMRVAIPGTLW